MFIDETVVILRAGNGGDGCISFRREKYLPKGGPNGGDGGKGGDVLLLCDVNVGDLIEYKYRPNWSAKNGEPGRGSDQHGRNGTDCILRVPPGTVVYNKENGRFVTELTKNEQQICLLKGGRGGFGNAHFKSSTNQAPRKATPGKRGEEEIFIFELKTIADIGLVGFPNAGKSSLLNLITHAHPKTAAYPFTTLHVNVGILEYPQYHDRLIIADIPGLIQGASKNKGLGHRFLRHIERCKLLVFLLDMAGVDGRDPLQDYEELLEELRLYNPMLLEKPRVIIGNKMDLPEASENRNRLEKKEFPCQFFLSCLTEEGVSTLKEGLHEIIFS